MNVFAHLCVGHLFGKGIYFADSFSKSAGYCHNWSSGSSTRFMLVCQVRLKPYHNIHVVLSSNKCDVTLCWLQVALGKQQKVSSYLDNSEGLAEGKNSKLAMSAYMPDPVLNITTPSGEPTSLPSLTKTTLSS